MAPKSKKKSKADSKFSASDDAAPRTLPSPASQGKIPKDVAAAQVDAYEVLAMFGHPTVSLRAPYPRFVKREAESSIAPGSEGEKKGISIGVTESGTPVVPKNAAGETVLPKTSAWAHAMSDLNLVEAAGGRLSAAALDDLEKLFKGKAETEKARV